MNQVVGLFLNIILFVAAWWASRSVLYQRGTGTLLLATCVIAWSWCILGMQILGSFARLSMGAFTLWIGGGIAVAIITSWIIPAAEITNPNPQKPPDPPISWGSILCLTFLTWVCLDMAMQSLLYPVKVMSDGPIYHLYFAIRWWKAGEYFLIAAPFGENAATYFPANGDLWFSWLMMVWDGDRLARIGQSPFLMIAGFAAYLISRTLGAGRDASIIATAWFLTSTALLVFSFQANVDTIFIANYVMASFFLLRFARGEDGTASLLLGGLASGGALGTKSVAIVFIPPLLMLALVPVLLRPGSTKVKVLRMLTLLFAPFVLSGFWYIQSTLLTGNPLYPLRVELFGHKLLTGWYGTDAMVQSPFYIPVSDWKALGDILLGILDPRLASIWLFAVCGLWAIPPAARPDQSKCIWLFSLMAIVNILLYWLLIPYRTQQRFMLHALGIAVVPLAHTFDRYKWLRVVATLLLILHVVTPQTWPITTDESQSIPWDLSPIIPNQLGPPLSLFASFTHAGSRSDAWLAAMNLAMPIAIGSLTGIVVWSWARHNLKRRFTGLAFPTVSAALLILAASYAYSPVNVSPKQLFFPPFRDFYLGWMNFDALAGPDGSRVAYAGTNIPYYLFGTGLRNDIRYVNIDAHRDWLLHDYHRRSAALGNETWPNSRPGWDREHPDYTAWLANLDAQRIKLLVVTRVNTSEGAHNVADLEEFPIERQWADAHPERFQMLYGERERDPWFRIYRLIRPQS